MNKRDPRATRVPAGITNERVCNGMRKAVSVGEKLAHQCTRAALIGAEAADMRWVKGSGESGAAHLAKLPGGHGCTEHAPDHRG